jgi:head-tail adaptor
MARGKLERYRDEEVRLMTEAESAPNRLGEAVTTYTPGATVTANVQPLGAEEAERAGLVADRELLRVQISPAVEVTPGDHLLVRGRERNVVRAEVWRSYTLAIVEPL